MTSIPDDSPHAVTVPGAVDAWCRLAADYGSKGLDEILAPAIRAAENGFVIPPRSALDWARYGDRIAKHKTGIPVYLPGGVAPGIGGKLSHPALGATLRRIAREGRAAFYEGAVAEEIVATLKAMGGLMQLDDLASARADYVAPIGADYRGHRIWQCPPNGQGVAALLIARILAGFDMADRDAQRSRPHSSPRRGDQGGLPAARRAGRRSGVPSARCRGAAVGRLDQRRCARTSA